MALKGILCRDTLFMQGMYVLSSRGKQPSVKVINQVRNQWAETKEKLPNFKFSQNGSDWPSNTTSELMSAKWAVVYSL